MTIILKFCQTHNQADCKLKAEIKSKIEDNIDEILLRETISIAGSPVPGSAPNANWVLAEPSRIFLQHPTGV